VTARWTPWCSRSFAGLTSCVQRISVSFSLQQLSMYQGKNLWTLGWAKAPPGDIVISANSESRFSSSLPYLAFKDELIVRNKLLCLDGNSGGKRSNRVRQYQAVVQHSHGDYERNAPRTPDLRRRSRIRPFLSWYPCSFKVVKQQ